MVWGLRQFSGSASTIQVLVANNADVEARDSVGAGSVCVGLVVDEKFPGFGWYEGEVIEVLDDGFCNVRYNDGKTRRRSARRPCGSRMYIPSMFCRCVPSTAYGHCRGHCHCPVAVEVTVQSL